MVKFDSINRKILKILQSDSSITNAELAEEIGLTPSTTLERVKKLEQAGIIKQYAALLDYEKTGMDVTVFTEIMLTDHSTESMRQFVDSIKKIPEVLECFLVSGGRDFLVKVVTKDIKYYKQFATEKLAVLPHVGRIESIFVLSTEKYETAIPVENLEAPG